MNRRSKSTRQPSTAGKSRKRSSTARRKPAAAPNLPPPPPTSVQDAATAVAKAEFLKAYMSVATVSGAAAIAGVGRRTHYDWLEQDREYAAAFDDAVEVAADRLEVEARRRAVEGLVRYKFNKDGTPVWHPDCYGSDPNAPEGKETEYSPKPTGAFRPYFEREYSDTLLIFLLKGARPAKYATQHKHTGSGKKGAILLEEIVAGAVKDDEDKS